MKIKIDTEKTPLPVRLADGDGEIWIVRLKAGKNARQLLEELAAGSTILCPLSKRSQLTTLAKAARVFTSYRQVDAQHCIFRPAPPRKFKK